MAAEPAARRRRGLAIVALVVVILLFVGEMVALALGALEGAVGIAIILTIGWFVLRSHRRKAERTR
jgi:positive regulator of sigma E activity